MLYQLGDRVVINGIQCEIGYINAGYAWAFPVDAHQRDGGQHSLVPWASYQQISQETEEPYVHTTCGAV